MELGYVAIHKQCTAFPQHNSNFWFVIVTIGQVPEAAASQNCLAMVVASSSDTSLDFSLIRFLHSKTTFLIWSKTKLIMCFKVPANCCSMEKYLLAP